ncbi:hypothetical protein V5O48_010267 [Marasmius crinis-equi]|uniref:Uncharacterized protein n=1 Tax=Marasmius crinis-equi TaxID=585013 RepID=A0ABR3F8V4_9AGAR
MNVNKATIEDSNPSTPPLPDSLISGFTHLPFSSHIFVFGCSSLLPPYHAALTLHSSVALPIGTPSCIWGHAERRDVSHHTTYDVASSNTHAVLMALAFVYYADSAEHPQIFLIWPKPGVGILYIPPNTSFISPFAIFAYPLACFRNARWSSSLPSKPLF